MIADRDGGSAFAPDGRPGSAEAFDAEIPSRVVVASSRGTGTNDELTAAFERLGYRSLVLSPAELGQAGRGDVVLGRLDVRRSLDGVEPGLDELAALAGSGAQLLNGATQLLLAHDKLATALMLVAAGVRHPLSVHVCEAAVPPLLDVPCVIKPRFGSWGRDVLLCQTRAELRSALREISTRPWFASQGALAQQYIPNRGSDLRAVVAGRSVVGGIERIAPAGEWRTNVALGATRHPVELPPDAALLALQATAALGIDLAGVDMVRDPGGALFVLEVNGAVDFTPDYLPGRNVYDAAVGALLPPGPWAAPSRGEATTSLELELELADLVEVAEPPDTVAPPTV